MALTVRQTGPVGRLQMAFQGTLYITDQHVCFTVEERSHTLPIKVQHRDIKQVTRQRPQPKKGVCVCANAEFCRWLLQAQTPVGSHLRLALQLVLKCAHPLLCSFACTLLWTLLHAGKVNTVVCLSMVVVMLSAQERLWMCCGWTCRRLQQTDKTTLRSKTLKQARGPWRVHWRSLSTSQQMFSLSDVCFSCLYRHLHVVCRRFNNTAMRSC